MLSWQTVLNWQTVATWLVMAAGIYAGLGALFAAAFVTRGAGRLDESARRGTWGFRVLIFPGAAALWPLLLKRWIGGRSEPPVEKNPHRARAGKAAS